MHQPTADIVSRLIRLRASVAVFVACLAVAAQAALAPAAQAAHGQVAILQDDPLMLSDPGGTMLRARQLGVDTVRLMLRWQAIAPSTNSFQAPHFDATNPAAYSAASWAPYDAVIVAAKEDGINIDLDLLGGAPLWATGPQMPHGPGYPFHNWEPSAAKYGQFVRAVATRYSGNYNPVRKRIVVGSSHDLPRVALWSIWNEPDYGPSLAPQAVPGLKGVEAAPLYYRALVDQAWSALHASGHGADTILWGELAPRGTADFGNFNGMTPLHFIRALYCVGASFRPLVGPAAQSRGCPTTAAGRNGFKAAHPALFAASGVSDHPYMRWYSPDREVDYSPEYTSLAEINNLSTMLYRATAAYHSAHRFPLWNTEFGYITSGPKRIWAKDHNPYASQTTSAYYDNWAEYLSWRNPNVMSFDQYLIKDAVPPLRSNDYGGFASGLLEYSGHPKPGYAAWRLPVYLPQTTASSPSQALEVWGAARPARFAQLDLMQPQSVELLYAPTGTSSLSLLSTVPVTDPHGYFDTHVTFPASGTLILRYTYPQDTLLGAYGTAIYSRHVKVTVR